MVANPASSGAERPGVRRNTDWRVPLVLAGIAISVALPGAWARELMRYERAGLAQGEWWRLVSGHFAHLGFSHLLLNLAGLAAIWLLVGAGYRARAWIFISLFSLAVIDLGFYTTSPGLEWYVGMSGMLHGLLAAGLLSQLRTEPVESLLLTTALVAKLVYEQAVGPLPGSEWSSGGSVVVDAHLYGAFGGVVAGGFLQISVAIIGRFQGAKH